MSDLNLEDIQPKMALSGVIKRLELTGIILDVGLPYDALLLNANISRKGSSRQEMSVGDSLDVWVIGVDDQRRFVTVTTSRPPKLDWQNVAVGDVFQGKVIRIKPFGVFVDIGAERPGLVHISELAHDYVKTPEDVVRRGDNLDVKVIGVDVVKRQIDLSVKALTEQLRETVQAEQAVDAEEETQVEIATAMAVAFEKARDRIDRDNPLKASKKRSAKSDEIDDIIKRTLKGRSD